MIGLHRHRLSVLAVTLSLCAGCAESGRTQYEVPSPPVGAPLAAEVDPFIGTAADGLEGVFVNGGYRHGDPQIQGPSIGGGVTAG